MALSPADLGAELETRALADGMSGLVSIDVDGVPVFVRAYGLADRAHGIANTTSTRFALASASKGFTAVTALSLVEEGVLTLDTPARTFLRDDLALVDDAVTIEHLLTHTSGIGDYLDEENDWDVDDYILPIAVHRLAETEAFVEIVDGFPQAATPGAEFTYNNGGYILLALIAERASGIPFHDLVQSRVFDRAGMTASGFLRLDELPGDAAIGYLSDDPAVLRTNVLHLPVRGNGDSGAFSTGGDLSLFWRALVDGRLVGPDLAAEIARPRHTVEEEGLRYGMGSYVDLDGPGLILEGYDAGSSIRTRFDPLTRTTVTVVSNTSEGAWGVVRHWFELIAD